MSEFINRIKDSMEYQEYYESQPIYFRALVCFIVIFEYIFRVVLFMISFITVPFWIVPYLIYTVVKTKLEEKKELNNDNTGID